MRTLIAYVPVLHEGYLRLFRMHEGPKELLLLGQDITGQFSPLAKDIRQLDPELMKKAIEGLGIFQRVEVLDEAGARALDRADVTLVLPDEEVSRAVAVRYFPQAHTQFVSIFLRWDKHNALKEKPVIPEEMITREQLHRDLLGSAQAEAGKSSDFWRHVGALVAKDGHIISAGHNAHVPSEHTPYVNGDPRNEFHRGDHIEFSTALHAEAGLIAQAARRGFPLEGADMYVTVFPCPPCAKLIAYSGIKTLYCGGGYAVLDGEDVLKSRGVKIVFVE